MHCTVIGPNLHTSKIVTAISTSCCQRDGGLLFMRHITFFRGSRGQQLFSPCFISFAQLRRVLQNPQLITVRIKAILLRRFNQAVNHAAGLRATGCIGKQPVLPAHDNNASKTDFSCSSCFLYRSSGVSSANACSSLKSCEQYRSPMTAGESFRFSCGRVLSASSNFRRACAQQPTTRMLPGSL